MENVMSRDGLNSLGLTFREWEREVDRDLVEICQMPSECLADYPSRSLWECDVEPAAAAVECLVRWNDYPEEELPEEYQGIL